MSPTSSLVFPEAKHFVSKENYHNYFDAKIPPVLTVNAGDLVEVETNDCFHGQIHPSLADPSAVVNSLPRDVLNPVTGPIYVRKAEPGDWLAVKLIHIVPKGVGVACCGSHSGQLCHWMKEDSTATKFFDLSQDGKVVTMRDSLEQSNRRRMAPIAFPAAPMLGVIGVAPKGDEPIITMPAGKHGGNLDNKCNGIGATVYLPVNHPGALLSMGDMHASQGDGEISGSGVEIGGNVLLQCEVLKQSDLYKDADASLPEERTRLQFPVTESATHWITHGVLEENIPQTTNLACEEAAKILMGQWGFTAEEAFIFLSVKGDLGLCQSCHPDQGTQIAKMMVPKLEACPRPFRSLLEG